MDWSLAERYLCQKKEFFDGEITKLKDEIQKMKAKKGELYEQIKDSEGKIDEAYEVFAVNPAKNNIIKKEIQTFHVEVDYLNQQILMNENTIRNYECESGLLHQIFGENHQETNLYTDEIINNENQYVDESIDSKEVCSDLEELIEEDKVFSDIEENLKEDSDKIIQQLKQQNIEKQPGFLEENMESCILDKTIINDLIYRCENLKRFMNVDRQRSQIEIINIIQILNGLL